jgi:hypothetical protein
MKSSLILAFVITILIFAIPGAAQSTVFTYQGSLKDGANPATGNYDFEFRLFDAAAAGAQIGSPISLNATPVAAGIFTVSLDFGAAFPGANRFLDIRVRPAGVGTLVTLTPRPPVTSAPYSIKSLVAESATNAAQLGSVAAAQYVQTTDLRMSDARPPTAGSANYVQNTNIEQAGNFNLSGAGRVAGTLTAGTVRANTQFNIGANRVFSTPGLGNTFAGLGSGASNLNGTYGSFFGFNAGRSVTTSDPFFVEAANSFFGSFAGENTNMGSDNSFFGTTAGAANVAGSGNALFGNRAGWLITSSDNSFFGNASGVSTTSGSGNTFIGGKVGRLTTTGNENVFVGHLAGDDNQSGSNNTVIGSNANVGTASLSYATALGANAVVSNSNSVVLGRPGGEDAVRIPGSTIINGSLVVDVLGTTNTNTHLCRNSANRLAGCTTNFAERSEVETLRRELEDQRKVISALIGTICRMSANAEVCPVKE